MGSRHDSKSISIVAFCCRNSYADVLVRMCDVLYASLEHHLLAIEFVRCHDVVFREERPFSDIY